MGKDLRGRELGVGISQRKDGLYTARFTDKTGKRRQQYFKKLQECRNWLADAQFQDEHGGITAGGNMSVSAWFEYWIEHIKGENIKPNTSRNYRDRFKQNIKPLIGDMVLSDIRAMHCQNILNQMALAGYASSTIGLTRVTMYVIFESAVENDIIVKNPVTKAVKCTGGKEPKEKRVLTVDEQRIFMESASKNSSYNQYALVLQTGLRTGELAGLKWEDVDFDRGILHVKRSIDYRSGAWEFNTPKSKSGYRDIPLTEEAVRLLRNQKKKMKEIKVIPIEFSDVIFLNMNGNPIKNSTYDKDLTRICKKNEIRPFSMHTLRHTFATRCIEAGMKPKILQSILGHADIGITMNLYVHATEEEKAKEVSAVEEALKVV